MSAGSDYFALSFFPLFSDRQLQALLLYFSLQLLQDLFCRLHQLFVPPTQENLNVTEKTWHPRALDADFV